MSRCIGKESRLVRDEGDEGLGRIYGWMIVGIGREIGS